MFVIGVKIVTDSTADLPQGLADELDIAVVPLNVHFGEEEYLDWIDLDSDSFFEKLQASEVMPRTSQPSPADFEAVYKRVGEDGDTIISLHISAELSGTYQSATIAKSMLEDMDIEVIDSKLTSMALGIVVVEAARAARDGKSKEEILSVIYEQLGKVKVYFGVDTLEYLQKNGRIGKAAALLGGLLSLKPILTLVDGMVVPKDKVRGRVKLQARVVDLVGEELGADVTGKAVILHGNVLEEALKLKDKIEAKYNFSEIIISSIGAVIGTHTGPGVLGVAVLPDKKQV
ncbi:DegV family protein [Dethiobacter alkaliphilus]|uniref:DegV family protein n=1 Tax=Dethiobacter alkaliphilus AHT 1 TaxID=555088 RepID=C0GHJ4_DETAL|nr:DegV family protein [Dethiobacter alkaliphilus]EEG77200.1 degV family protein [Dethiobacter alkaliphilus AHT 1]